MNSTHSAGLQKARQDIRRDRGGSELPDVVARASDALIQFLLNAGQFIEMNFQRPLRFNFFGVNFNVLTLHFTMKLFRDRRATTRSENPQPDIRTPSLLLCLEGAFSPAFTNRGG